MSEKLKDINEIYGKTTHISEINKCIFFAFSFNSESKLIILFLTMFE